MSIRRQLLAACVSIGLSMNAARAANPTATPAPADDNSKASLTTRVFNASDLLWQQNDYPAMFQGDVNSAASPGASLFPNGGNGAQPGQPDKTSATPASPATMIKLIEDTVAPETWRDNGGQLGSIRELAGQLVVTQTPENLTQIQNILDAFRDARSRMVVVRAYWLLLPPELLPSLSSSKELPVIDDKLIDAKHLYCGAQTMCFSGQTVHVTSGRSRTMVVNVTPVVGSNVVGYQVTPEMARSGVVLQVTPHLEPEGQDPRVTLDLQSNVTEVGDHGKIELPDSYHADPTTQQSTASIDRINEINQELHTTVRLPLGKKVLIGGMTLEPASKEDPTSQLYLVIEADAVK